MATPVPDYVSLAMPFHGSSAQDASEVEFLRTGTFTDLNGNEVVVSEDFLAQLATNFAANTAQQEIPVDVMHKRAEAVGWVTNVVVAGDRGRATIQWNPLGRQLVQDRVYRYLSASIERETSVLRSISLTNFPAVKGLAPLELSEFFFEDSLDQQVSHIGEVFGMQFPDMEVVETYTSYVIAGMPGDEYVRVPYVTDANGNTTFASQDQWQAVVRVWQDEAQPGADIPTGAAAPPAVPTAPARMMPSFSMSDGGPMSASEGGLMSEQVMTEGSAAAPVVPAPQVAASGRQVAPPAPQMVVAEMQAPQVAASVPQVAASAPQVAASAPQAGVSPSQVSLEMLSEAARESLMAEMAQRFEAGKDKMFGELMEQWRTERTILQFAERLTAGNQRALPVKQADLVSLLKEMPTPLRDKTMMLLQHIFTQGLVDLSEHGTSLTGGTVKALPADMKTALQAWVAAGHKLDVFFEANELGAMGQYDLTEFAK